jgi:hypothetical protein
MEYNIMHPCNMDGFMELKLASCAMSGIPKPLAGEITRVLHIFLTTHYKRFIYA